MRRAVWVIRGLFVASVLLAANQAISMGTNAPVKETIAISLPPPASKGAVSLEEALAARRSIREFRPSPLSRAELSQLLWAAQGETGRGGLRAAPSAGALYPLELYVATAEGFFHYEPHGHQLTRRAAGDLRPALRRAALGQAPVGEAPALFLIAAEAGRTASKYGRERTPRYVAMEAGHAAQNLLLQAAALKLGGVPIGAFEDARLHAAAGLPPGEEPLYLIAVGKPR